MAKINKEGYEILKGLDVEWNWIARDERGELYIHEEKPKKIAVEWVSERDYYLYLGNGTFQFIQWEDEEPYCIQELIEEYESELFKNTKIVKLDANKLAGNASDYKHFYKRVGESEETEMRFKEKLKQEVEKIMTVTESYGSFTVKKEVDVYELFDLIDQLDEPEPKKITLQDVAHRLWEIPLNSRKYWLERLNDEFQEGYIVPLGLKTTDWEEQYLTFNGSYFACRRDKSLKQTFATLEEIPEFYRDLAERML